jgi:hypothetical protein
MTTRAQAFPIPVQLSGSHGTHNAKIQRLTSLGCLIEIEKPLGMGHHYTLTFVLPGYHEQITAVGVVVKAYTGLGGEPGKSKSHTLDELHFKPLSDHHRTLIDNFVKVVGGKR